MCRDSEYGRALNMQELHKVLNMCYGKCNKIGNYAYFLAVMYNF